ncbi:MAG: TIGR02530 family flagellar biosynthesis protein [Solirubrobacterales bacterium]
MNNKIYIPEPIRPIGPKQETPKPQVSQKSGQSAFDQILSDKMGAVKFSNHAQQRLKSRNIELGPQEMEQLQSAVAKAREKGSRESLILMKDLALVVSIKNNTVITAVDGDSIKENVFTNIDSAVVV